MRSRYSGFLAVLIVLCLPPTHARAQAAVYPIALDSLLDTAEMRNAWWGVLAVNLNTGDTLYARNAHRSFIPASNTKLYTTAAALERLGPDFRYETRLYVTGEVRDSVLYGNLIVRGSGDPVIGGRFTDGDRTAVFRAWADSLRAAGIRRITGDLIGDDDVFDDVPLGYGWSWDDEPYWYAAEISGLSFNDNCVDVALEATTPGAPAIATWEPEGTDFVTVENASFTLPSDSTLEEGYARERGSNHLRLFSHVPAGTTDTESLSITNPTLFFVHTLRRTLILQGIAVEGRPVDVDDLSIRPSYEAPGPRRIALHRSPPLADIVYVLNKESQNLYAEQVLKTLGARFPEADTTLAPGSAAMGIEAAMPVFVHAGIDTTYLQLYDGSGMSRQNLVTPAMTVSLLRYLWDYPDDSTRVAFWDSLPVGGVDGTLEYRFRTSEMRGRVRAKTGTVSNVSTLSGVVEARDGTPVAFSLMANHFTIPTRRIRAVQDTLVTLLARYGGGVMPPPTR